jgi:hypothetical protein
MTTPITRRTVLSLPILACAACAAEPAEAGKETAAVTCPTPTAGAVTGQTGFLTALVDAFSYDDGQPYQGQLVTIATDKPGGCTHFRANQVVRNEVWLRLMQIKGFVNDPYNRTPLDYLPGTYTVGQAVYQPDGSMRQAVAYHTPHGRSCSYKDNQASAGTITWTTVDLAAGMVSGSYNLTFNAGTVAGDFTAPVCALAGCPPRPTSSTCVDV